MLRPANRKSAHQIVTYELQSMMFEIHESLVFSGWVTNLRDAAVRARVQARILRLAHGNPEQYRALTQGLCEMKIDFGPGFRVYYTQRGRTVVVLLCGGDNSSQQADIAQALELASGLDLDATKLLGDEHGNN
jgi:putative addiction module killer protein